MAKAGVQVASACRPKALAVILLSLLGLCLTSQPALAITDFNGFTCRSDGTNSINNTPSFTNGPFGSIAAGLALLHIAPNQSLELLVSNGTGGFITRNDTNVIIIDPPLDNTETLGSGDVLIEVHGGIPGGPGGVSVTATCITVGPPPNPTPPGPTPPNPVGDDVAALLDGIDPGYPGHGFEFLWHSLSLSDFGVGGGIGIGLVSCTDDQATVSPEECQSFPPREDEGFDLDLPSQLEGAAGFTVWFKYRPDAVPQSKPNASLSAISNYFRIGGNGASATVPLQSTARDWAFDVKVEGDVVERTFAALNAQTWHGSVRVGGAHILDRQTAIGFGVAIIGANTAVTGTPAGTVNSVSLGADIEVLRMFSPQLYGGLFGNARIGAANTNLGGATGAYATYAFEGGGVIGGELWSNGFRINPAATASLEFRHRNGFTDSAGLVVPGSDIGVLKLRLGGEVARPFALIERDMVVSPFVGLDLLVDAYSGPAWINGPVTPGDPIRVEGRAGVELKWLGDAAARFEGTASRGATTTALGVKGTLSVLLN